MSKKSTPALAKKSPALPGGNDAEVAAVGLRLLKQANEGLLAAVALGFWADWVKANLPSGTFERWIEAHLQVTALTVWRWRATAKRMCELAGIQVSRVKLFDFKREQTPVHELLLLPDGQVPAEHRAIIAKLREVALEAKSQRAVIPKLIDGAATLDLVQCEDGADGLPTPKRGRRKGEGGASKQQRAVAAAQREEDHLADVTDQAEALATAMLALGDDRHLGLVDDALLARVTEAHATLGDYLAELAERRGGN